MHDINPPKIGLFSYFWVVETSFFGQGDFVAHLQKAEFA
jgi:hypothetical protein